MTILARNYGAPGTLISDLLVRNCGALGSLIGAPLDRKYGALGSLIRDPLVRNYSTLGFGFLTCTIYFPWPIWGFFDLHNLFSLTHRGF